jgi:uncharacterized protein with von Willebrand factor type A (vWA) domain
MQKQNLSKTTMNKFSYFETFGLIADENKRKQLAVNIYDNLQTISEHQLELSNTETENFSDTIENILSGSSTMRKLCAMDIGLSEEMTLEILDFINTTKRKMIQTYNPFEEEQAIFKKFEIIEKNNFTEQWEDIYTFLKKNYKYPVFNIDFYKEKFYENLNAATDNKNNDTVFEGIKKNMIENWGTLLFQKQTAWELKIIDEERKMFCEELYRRIEELKKLQELLAPFTNELGRLWDMSKGRWQKVNFDILKKYAELLQKDKSLQELAEMLGRMRQSERGYEEELFTDMVIKPEWKVEHAGKADLVGIHESDDISSMLPAEAALLSDDITEILFYKKFTEKKLQTYDYQNKILSTREEEIKKKRQKEKEDKKGPFIICVDTSGSMHGTPETVAKTLCFAILKMAIRDNRKCYLISFSTDIETLNLTDIKNSLDKLIAFLSMSFNGGTDAAPAMMEALRMLEAEDYKKADLIMVSDFIISALDEQTKARINAARETKTKFHSLVIGQSGNKATLEDFDSNWVYDENNPDRVLSLVKDINTL